MKNQRSQIMIKSHFQQRLILSTLLITLIALNGILIIAGLLDARFGGNVVVDIFRLSVAVMEIMTVIIVFFISRRISFHIAGPVYAVERTLRHMAEGSLTQRLNLRKGDQFGEVAEVINEVLAAYQTRIGEAQALLDAGPELTAEQQTRLAEHLRWFATRAED